MRLVTFYENGRLHIGGLIFENGIEYIVDFHKDNSSIPSNLIELFKIGPEGLQLANEVLKNSDIQEWKKIDDIILAPPIPNPSKIICLGLNYKDHSPKNRADKPEFPTIFAKYNNCLIGSRSQIILPGISTQIDYEAEMAIIIGQRGKNIPFSNALDYIAGVTAFNDVSARDIQTRTSQWLQGKTFDTFGPMGPCVVTLDEIKDIQNLEISLVLNGKTMQNSNTKNMIFSVQEIVTYLSEIMTLEIGDIISTGTPGGVGVLHDPSIFLKNGDLVEVNLEGVGKLTNTVSN